MHVFINLKNKAKKARTKKVLCVVYIFQYTSMNRLQYELATEGLACLCVFKIEKKIKQKDNKKDYCPNSFFVFKYVFHLFSSILLRPDYSMSQLEGLTCMCVFKIEEKIVCSFLVCKRYIKYVLNIFSRYTAIERLEYEIAGGTHMHVFINLKNKAKKARTKKLYLLNTLSSILQCTD